MAQIGQLVYLQRNTNGIPSYSAEPFAGNIPWGATELSKEQYIQGLEQKKQEVVNYLALPMSGNTRYLPGGQNYQGQTYRPGDEQGYQAEIDAVKAGTGKYASTYQAPGMYSGPKTAENVVGLYSTPQSGEDPNEAAVRAGTMTRVPIGTGWGYIPTGSPAARSLEIGQTAGTQTTAQPASSATATSGTVNSAIPNITRNLQPGMSGEDVKALQSYLIAQGFDIPAGATGNYGPQTQAAVAQWQTKTGVQAGADAGYFGPKSIAALKATSTQTTPQTQAEIEKAAYNLAETVAQGAIENGKTLDPNVDYSLVDFTTFLDQAKTVVSPYYQSKISGLVDSFKQNMASLGADLSAFETKTTKEAESTKLAGEETLAGRGLAFSSGRETFTKQLGEQTQTTLEQGRRGIAETAQKGLTGLEQDIGTTRAVGALGTTPTIGGRQLSFGTTPTTGEIPFMESESTINRARALASDENARRAMAQNASIRASLGFA